MKLPFVSRGRFEDLQARLAKCEAERDSYLERILGKPVEPVKAVASLEIPAEQKSADVIPFTTPFDRIEQRCSTALRNGQVGRQYAARMR